VVTGGNSPKSPEILVGFETMSLWRAVKPGSAMEPWIWLNSGVGGGGAAHGIHGEGQTIEPVA
jgi:hypothetical protein